MSETVPTKVITELQKLEPDAIVELFELDCAIFGGALYPFHNQRLQGAQTLKLGGVLYQPIAIEASGFAHNGTEQSATPTVGITSLGGIVQGLIAQYDNLTGAKLRRIRTFRKWLDDGSEPDPTARLSDDIFFVERKVSDNKEVVTFQLDSSLNVDGVMIPARKILPRCQARFKDGVNCPYVGADTTCGKYLSDCAEKFGADADLPFMGFAAVERVSLNV